MTILATTKSGSEYIFTQNENGELLVMKGIMTGKVTQMHRPIEVGNILEFDFIRDGIYGEPEGNPMYFQSTELVTISVSDLVTRK